MDNEGCRKKPKRFLGSDGWKELKSKARKEIYNIGKDIDNFIERIEKET